MTESIGEPLSTDLIELPEGARGRRYRGHHDAEFFLRRQRPGPAVKTST